LFEFGDNLVRFGTPVILFAIVITSFAVLGRVIPYQTKQFRASATFVRRLTAIGTRAPQIITVAFVLAVASIGFSQTSLVSALSKPAGWQCYPGGK
jgi:hypothetical protein